MLLLPNIVSISCSLVLPKQLNTTEMCVQYIKENEYTFRGDNSVKIVLSPNKKELTLKGKILLLQEQFLSFKSRHLLRRDLMCRKTNRKSQKLCPLFKKKLTEIYGVYSVFLTLVR